MKHLKYMHNILFISLFFLLGFLHCTGTDNLFGKLIKRLPKVTDLAVSRDSSTITLTWNNPTDQVFHKILILKSSGKILDAPQASNYYPVSTMIGASKVVYNAAAPTFTDTEIIEGAAYFYKIFAYDTSFNYASGLEVEFNGKIGNVKPPANITNYILRRNSNGIILSWMNPIDADFSKVLILKSTSSISHAPATGQDYAGVDSIGGSKIMSNAKILSFTDTEITEGATYFYKIFAYDTSFNYASGVQLEGDTASPKNVINSRFLNLDSNGITIAWSNPTNTDFSKVLILRSTSSIVDAPTTGQDYASVNADSIGSSALVYNSNASIFSDGEAIGASTHYYYKLFAYDASFNYASGVEISGGGSKADHDGDGLIEIYTDEMLDNMRHNLAGTSYKTSTGDAGNVVGCPASGGCNGYELTAHIDLLSLLDTNGSRSIDTKDETVGAKTHEVIDTGTGKDTSWMPIGDISDPFTSTFEGNNHTIANLWVNISSSSNSDVNAGLFGVTGGTVVIRNVGIISGSIHAYVASSASAHSGGLVGDSSTGSSLTITNCNFAGSGGISSSSILRFSDAGGLVGHIDGAVTITNCHFSGSAGVSTFANLPSSTGGLVGFSGTSSLTIINSSFSGLGGVSGGSSTGGLVGKSGGAVTITNCHFLGSGGVSSASASGESNAGGLVGRSDASLTITNCHFSGSGGVSSVSTGTSVSHSGGLVGYSLSSLAITNCTFSGSNGVSSISASGRSSVGGLVGWSENILTITNCHFLGSAGVSSSANPGYSYSGGLVGINFLDPTNSPITASLTITKSSFSGSAGVSSSANPGYSFSGGLVGSSTDSASLIIIECTVSGSGGISSSDSSGGLVGYSTEDTTITNSYFSGSGDISALNNAGGLVGISDNSRITGSSSSLTITNSYFSGSGDISASSTSAESHSGGLVGYFKEILSITNSYFTGSADISATSNSGGLVGRSGSNSTLTITRSYFAGSDELLASSGFSGGLVGSSGSSSTIIITNSYWNTDATQSVGISEQSPERARGDIATEPSGTTGLTLTQLKATSAPYPSGLLRGVVSTQEAWDLGTDTQLPAVKLCIPTTTNGVTDWTMCTSHGALLPGQR